MAADPLLVFLHGPPAVGKLTVARELAALTGLPLFHNHLVVDAVAAVFPFGDPAFIRLREAMWIQAFAEAAAANRSLIFTFQPEPTVARDFPARARWLFREAGGDAAFIALTAPDAELERRIGAPDRAAFGKTRSPDLLRGLREAWRECEAAMPDSALTLDAGAIQPQDAARRIALSLGLPTPGQRP